MIDIDIEVETFGCATGFVINAVRPGSAAAAYSIDAYLEGVAGHVDACADTGRANVVDRAGVEVGTSVAGITPDRYVTVE